MISSIVLESAPILLENFHVVKPLLAFLTFLLALNLSFCPLVLAGTLNMQGSGTHLNSLSGDAPVHRIGKIKLQNGVAVLKDNRIDVLFDALDLTEKTATSDEKKSLTGTCFGISKSVRGGRTCVTGFTYMDGGTSFAQIDQPGVPESVSLNDGTICHGKITSVTNDHLTVHTDDGDKQIDTTSIKAVNSPRVFAMSIPYAKDGQSSEATFTPTCGTAIITASASTHVEKQTKIEKQTNSDNHLDRKKKIIVVLIVACLIATAIAVPIAVAAGGHHGGHSNAFANQVAYRNLFARERAGGPAEP